MAADLHVVTDATAESAVLAERDAAARDFIDCVVARKRARWHKVPMVEFARLCAAYGVEPPPREAS